MKKLILATAAVALTASTAFAGDVYGLNSQGERKQDYATLLQLEKSAPQAEAGLDYTPTASIGGNPNAVSVTRVPDDNGGYILQFSRVGADGQRVVFNERHISN